MGIGTVNAAAQASAKCFGSGETSTPSEELTLCRMSLSAGERAAKFSGFAVSSLGETREVRAVGHMIPEEGWVLHSSGTESRVELVVNAATADFIIEGGGAATWIGYLEAEFCLDYSPA